MKKVCQKIIHDTLSFYTHFIKLTHEVVPKVVAIAVRIVIARWIIFFQNSFFMVLCCFLVCVFFCTTEDTEFHR